jgi:hypothetical protein
MNTVSIYGLVDPFDGRVRYVGKTESRLHRRLQGHLQHARKRARISCSEWVLNLLAQGLRPEITLIETVEIETWVEREQYWIAEYRRRYPDLLNRSPGGRGGGSAHMTESVIQRLRAAGKEQWEATDPERRRRHAQSSRERWTPEFRESQRTRGKEAMRDPEFRRRLAEGTRSVQARTAQAERLRAWWEANPERRKILAEQVRQSFKDPARRAAHGALSQLIFQKVAAKRLGISLEEYSAILAGGRKLCTACGILHQLSDFGTDRRSPDRRAAFCRSSRNAKLREKYVPKGRR